jgi:hypothetical protein
VNRFLSTVHYLLFPLLTNHNPRKESTMNLLANIWNHPRTSAAGLLIAIASIASVLSQQGITFGHAGTGTVISLIAALATALLGLLARDPGASVTQH